MKMPVDSINMITNDCEYISNTLNFSILNKYGVFVLKNAFPRNFVEEYLKIYNEYKSSNLFDRNKNHLTEVRISPENQLMNIIYSEKFNEIAGQLFPGGVGIYNVRIVKKDIEDKSPVFLHQDVGYQYGSFERFSFFIPLSICSKDNGGLTFVPGSHKFGYLGDAGAIRESLLPENLQLITPEVVPGDLIIMNSYVWHKSGDNKDGTDRIYYDIHVNSSDDPASKYFLNGVLGQDYYLNYSIDEIFENSRLQRLEKYMKTFGKI